MAIHYFAQATNVAPESSEFLRNYLVALNESGDNAAIASKTQDILRHFGDQVEILKASVLACRKAGSDDNLFRLLYRLHELEPLEPSHLDAIAGYGELRGRTTDRLFAAERLLKLQPNDINTLLRCFHLCNITGQLGDRDRYREQILSTVETDHRTAADFMVMLMNTTAQLGVLPTSSARQRYQRLFEIFNSAVHLEGEIAECGVLRGASTLMISQFQQRHDPGFDGTGYHVFDSFQGLSEIEAIDIEGADEKTKSMMYEGNFACSEEQFRESVCDFPGIAVRPGWIPARFDEVADRRFKFVHVDVDLAQPTYDSFAFFYPRLVAGGIIISDDGNWPGAKQAIEKFGLEVGIKPQMNEVNQIVLIKE